MSTTPASEPAKKSLWNPEHGILVPVRPENAYEVQLSEGVTLHVWPRSRMNFEEFKAYAPPSSIALDGFVTGPPAYDPNGPFRNFNHHEGVDGDCTRSTSDQVNFGLKNGLTRRFSQNGVFTANLFVEDCDEDVCESVWQLANHERIVSNSEPLINRHLRITDLQDAAGGTYGFDPTSQIMREMAWINDPYVQARLSGQLGTMDGAQMYNVIQAVMSNINAYTLGNGKQIELDTRYDIIGGGEGWKMTIEKGYYARAAYANDNIRVFTAVTENQDGSYYYSIGKLSQYDDFPLAALVEFLNQHEDVPCWGGRDTIVGSRGGNGSKFKPKELEELINDFLQQRELDQQFKNLRF